MTEWTRIAAACALLGVGCGSSTATLEIANEYSKGTSRYAITELQIEPCSFETVSPPRPVDIPFGDSYELELEPGCHVITVARGDTSLPKPTVQAPSRTGTTAKTTTNTNIATVRVQLEASDSTTWVPFRITDVEADDWKDCSTCK